MINEVRKLVSNIQQVENELAVMAEENIEVGMEKVKQVFGMAKVALRFEGIYKNAKKHGTPIEHRKHFHHADGGIIKGVLISSIIEDSNKTETGEIEEYKELFLLEDGSLKVYYAIHEWPTARKHSLYHKVTRTEFGFDQRDFQFDIVIRCIMQELERRQLELDCKKYFMKERLCKIKGLKEAHREVRGVGK